MRIYLAARYPRRRELRAYGAQLEVLGHEVTSNWLLTDDDDLDASMGTAENLPKWEEIAEEDVLDILGSDVFIQFTDGELWRGGNQFELGYAYRLDLDIMVVGPRVHAFHYLPGVRVYDNWAEAFEALQKDTGNGC